MPRFQIRMINSKFESTDELDYGSLELAREAGISAATNVVAESIMEGKATSAVEIEIFEGERLVSRQVVTLSIAEFTTGE